MQLTISLCIMNEDPKDQVDQDLQDQGEDRGQWHDAGAGRLCERGRSYDHQGHQ